ncbi:hypothetical protein D5018_11525 [Parashewanella curva]|uniref:Uncharacterized protein n=1 Tax=Parashewanella curva TaxID=2338552 RepID=A0A3L8PVW3_9GAMM|nr:hypothetical protein D5018_11525 [Parashewanella curva]
MKTGNAAMRVFVLALRELASATNTAQNCFDVGGNYVFINFDCSCTTGIALSYAYFNTAHLKKKPA